MRLLMAPFLLVVGACAQPFAPLQPSNDAHPVAAAFAAGAAAKELAAPAPDPTTLGWHLEIAGGRARFLACDDADTCGSRVVELPASDVLALKVVGRHDDADVVRLTLKHPVATSRGGSSFSNERGLFVGELPR